MNNRDKEASTKLNFIVSPLLYSYIYGGSLYKMVSLHDD